jgi:predicted permease
MAMLYLSCPTAVATYVMADQMGADRELAAGSIVLSTLLAFPAMAAILLLLA